VTTQNQSADAERDTGIAMRDHLADGIKRTLDFVMSHNPEMSLDEARAHIDALVTKECEVIRQRLSAAVRMARKRRRGW
jgi:hypothetical protein